MTHWVGCVRRPHPEKLSTSKAQHNIASSKLIHSRVYKDEQSTHRFDHKHLQSLFLFFTQQEVVIITETMVGGTSSDNNDGNHAEQSLPTPLTSTTYSCTSCQISFQNGQEQRIHMKEPWQYVG